MNDNLLRRDMAQEVAEFLTDAGTPATILSEPCPDCRCFLIVIERQDMPFCWFCVADRKAAAGGKIALLKARLAEHGIAMEDHRHMPDTTRKAPPTPRSSWPEGMAM